MSPIVGGATAELRLPDPIAMSASLLPQRGNLPAFEPRRQKSFVRRLPQYSSNGQFGQRSVTVEMERARSALAYIDPHGHDTWLKVGMGLKAGFGDLAWPIFDEWSRAAENYDARENRRRWQSFKVGGGISIATVYGMARDAGWRDDGTYRMPDPKELARRQCERAKADAEVTEKRDRAAAETAKKSAVIWSIATPATKDNPYCRRKGIAPTETHRGIEAGNVAKVLGYAPSAKGKPLDGPLLVVPIKVGDRLSSLQLIDGAGRKHFLAGGTIGGGYWATQKMPDGDGTGLMVLTGEGVATALSAVQAVPGALGVAAMSNGNIPTVVRLMRERYPRGDIVVLADLDKQIGEPDKHAAAAAEDIGGRLAVPRFADGPGADRKDFNDMLRVHGAEAVREVLKAAEVRQDSEGTAADPGAKAKTKVNLIRANTIAPEPVSWVWDGHLARGKVHILAGKPAAGKTTLAIAMAAVVSTGGNWPDGTQCQQGTVVIWSGEDDPADTLVPRLIAAGADLNRVHFVDGAIEDGEPGPFDPSRHMAELAAAIATLPDVALLIVDPVVSAVGGDSHKNTEVRRALQPLVDLVSRFTIGDQ